MPGSRLTVHLSRDSFNTPWGFRLQGGKDLTQPLTVQRVFSNSPADGELQRGDIILSINSRDASELTHKQAQDLIKHGGGQVQLIVNRPPPGAHIGPLSPPIVTQKPRAPSLQSPPSPNAPARPITFTSTITRDGSCQQPAQKPLYQPLDIQAAREQQNRDFQRQVSTSSQPPTTPTPPNPVPPWAAQQFSPKRLSKLSKLGGAGLEFGSTYATLPRKSSATCNEGRLPPERQGSGLGPEESPPDRLASGPIPKVCRLRNLGGGGYNFASGFGAATLPRASAGRHTSQPSSTSSAAGYGHQSKSYGQTPDQRVDYPHDRSGMLNRVQTSLDSITLSPRTPEVHTSSPFFQPYQKVYTPTGLLLEQQRLQTQQVDSEPIAPVWERRKQFQQGPVQTSPVKAPAKTKTQKFVKPKPAPTSFSGFGTDYSQASSKQPAGGWHPAPQFKPTPAPVPSSSVVTYTPTAIQYTPRVDPPPTRPSPLSPTYAPVQVTPPTWQRKEEEDSGTPAWGSTLKRTGVKPWEMDTSYSIDQQAVRSVPYNPPPAKSPISPGPFSPSGAPHPGGSENGPKVVHLQYNSPLHLYSNQNVAETLKGQTQALAGQTKPTPPSVNEAGERDWSQSAVLRYINQEDSRKSKQPAPAVAPKPQYSPVKAPKPYQPFQQEVGSSDF